MRSAGASRNAEAGRAASYAEHRRNLLAAAVPAAAITVFSITILYSASEAFLSPARFQASYGLYIVQSVVPLIALWLVRRLSRRYVEWVVLVADLTFTAALVADLLLATQEAFGLALLVSLKTVATAVLFPWGPGFQCASAGTSVLLYWGLLEISGRTGAAVTSLDYLLGPLVGALISAVGALTLDRARQALFRDMSERLRSEAMLRDARDQLQLVLAASKAGPWESDLRTGRSQYSPDWLALLGYGADDIGPGLDDWRQLVHPEDRQRLDGFIAKYLRDPSVPYEIEYRVLDKQGDWRWLLSRATLLRNAAGEPERLLGLHVDLTERKRTEARQRQAEGRFRRLIDANLIGIVIVDLRGTVSEANDVFLDLLGRGRDELPIRWNDLSPPQWRDANARAALELRQRGAATPWQQELLRKDGRPVPVLLGAALLEEGSDACAAFVLDLTRRKRAEENTAALLQVAHDVSGTLDMADLCKRVQLQTARLLQCEGVGTFHFDAARQVLRLFGHHGLPPQLVAAMEAVQFKADDLGGAGAGPVQGVTLIINDTDRAQGALARLSAQFGITAVAAAPLEMWGIYRGSLAVFRSGAQEPFEPWQSDLLAGVAKEYALGMEVIERYRAQQEEAAVSAALARLGEGLIAALGTPTVLDQLCRLTTEVLGCDASHTVLWDPESDAFRVVAAHGFSPEQTEGIRAVELPSAVLAHVLTKLEGTEVSHVGASDVSDGMQMGRQDIGLDVELVMALRRRGELIGVHSASYRHRREPFSPLQQRIARGIAHLSSLALEDFRLVEELERANRVKSDFLATISHELRTPLSILIGYNDLLREEAFGPLLPEQSETLGRMDRSARELLDLIEATLDISRLETGQLMLQLEDVAPAELLREVEAETHELREKKPGLAFRWDVDPVLPQIHTDRGKLKVILKNLLSNAVKFTEEGQISVSAVAQNGGVDFTVSDTGIGIPPEALPIIFEPFRQAGEVITRRHGGVGLGLYIVRRLLDRLGGTVRVESEQGRGARFQVSLPLTPARPIQSIDTAAA